MYRKHLSLERIKKAKFRKLSKIIADTYVAIYHKGVSKVIFPNFVHRGNVPKTIIIGDYKNLKKGCVCILLTCNRCLIDIENPMIALGKREPLTQTNLNSNEFFTSRTFPKKILLFYKKQFGMEFPTCPTFSSNLLILPFRLTGDSMQLIQFTELFIEFLQQQDAPDYEIVNAEPIVLPEFPRNLPNRMRIVRQNEINQ